MEFPYYKGIIYDIVSGKHLKANEFSIVEVTNTDGKTRKALLRPRYGGRQYSDEIKFSSANALVDLVYSVPSADNYSGRNHYGVGTEGHMDLYPEPSSGHMSTETNTFYRTRINPFQMINQIIHVTWVSNLADDKLVSCYVDGNLYSSIHRPKGWLDTIFMNNGTVSSEYNRDMHIYWLRARTGYYPLTQTTIKIDRPYL